MQTYFSVLPDEVKLHIVSFCSQPSNLLNLSEISDLSHLFDRKFRSHEVQKQFEITAEYFDLPLTDQRQISGRKRYLEIVSKFDLIPQSVISTENPEGIYDLKTASELAVRRGQVSFFDHFPHVDSEKVQRNFYLRKLGLVSQYEFKSLFGNSTLGGISEKCYFPEIIALRDQIIQMCQEKNHTNLYKFVKDSKVNMLLLSSIGNDTNSAVLQLSFMKWRTLGHKVDMLAFSICSGNFEQTQKLFQLLEYQIKPEIKQRFLSQAYYLCDITLIEFFEEKKILIPDMEKYVSLIRGQIFHPQPLKFYQIFETLSKLSNEKNINYIRISLENLDLDIFNLFKKKHQNVF
ncbi:hypothetical protein pv_249 [Pithovirus sibericum]|uniref:F-box domain-containing protein n=1 Tax=Pithovirus sibericum TaxID=1450746 RepID=W5S518_9VIRU|nr:hypothetical protein pv_249 [Pithovirus sibericum]AHH01816.1 hypothetical protein pv_249 [Pithovirus sibericum]